MAKPLSYLMEDPKKPHKPKEYYPQKAKGMSFFAFIFSIFIYISIFYIFDLSPSTLFNNTKFWFLISNTLILIIAADYGSFSSSNDNKRDVYDDYLVHREVVRRRSSLSFATTEYPETVAKVKSNDVFQKPHEDQNMQEKKEVAIVDQESENPEKKLQIVAKNDKENNEEDIQEKRVVISEENKVNSNNINKPRTYRRSKSEKAKRVVIDESKNMSHNVLRRSETIKGDQENVEEEINEFSTMSDEDLNRRVEEFIQRFNRQIRLQAQANYYDN